MPMAHSSALAAVVRMPFSGAYFCMLLGGMPICVFRQLVVLPGSRISTSKSSTAVASRQHCCAMGHRAVVRGSQEQCPSTER